jgi:hypothetical protein
VEQLQGTINNLYSVASTYVPKLVGALLLLVAAWLVVVILRAAARRLGKALKLDQRAGGALIDSIASIVYWLTFLFFLPGILEALGLQQLLVPVQTMIGKVLGYVPNLIGAALIFTIGLFVAKLVREIVSNLLAAVGADRLGERLGLASALGAQKLSGLAGLLVYVLIIIPVFQSALGALALEVVTRPVETMMAKILGAIPAIFTALVVLAAAHFFGKVLGDFTANVLGNVGFNALLMRLGLGQPENGARTPAEMVGSLVRAGVMIFALIEAAQVLGFTALSGLVSQFLVFASQLITGLVIFAVGLYLGNLAATAVQGSGIINADKLAQAARLAVLVLAGAMALRQMGLANEIINLAFGSLLGALAVAIAIAFGIGGRETAAKMVAEWRDNWKASKS